jgi:hypothetical protein
MYFEIFEIFEIFPKEIMIHSTIVYYVIFYADSEYIYELMVILNILYSFEHSNILEYQSSTKNCGT